MTYDHWKTTEPDPWENDSLQWDDFCEMFPEDDPEPTMFRFDLPYLLALFGWKV